MKDPTTIPVDELRFRSEPDKIVDVTYRHGVWVVYYQIAGNAGFGVVSCDSVERFWELIERQPSWVPKFRELQAEDPSWTLHEEGAECPCVGEIGSLLFSGEGAAPYVGIFLDGSEGWTDGAIVAYRIIKPKLEPMTPMTRENCPKGALWSVEHKACPWLEIVSYHGSGVFFAGSSPSAGRDVDYTYEGLADAMEYSTDGGKTWQRWDGGEAEL